MILQGSPIDFISAFLGGVLVSFSPCVYPLVPVTLGFIGVKSGSSWKRGLSLSLVYVLGLALTYSILGLVASFTGKLFGRVAAHPVSFFIIGNACILAGLSFFDLINIGFIGPRLQNKIPKVSNYRLAFLLGLASGLIAGPCTAPALGTILLYVASRQNVFYGMSLLFAFAYGMGFLLILSGTFSSFFINLPKSEKLSLWAKRISAAILIAIGEYFLIQAGRLM